MADSVEEKGDLSEESPDVEEKEAAVRPDRPGEDQAAKHMGVLALTLYDATRPLHALKKNNRRIMELAALYQHIPLPKGKKKPVRAVRKALVKQMQEEITPDDVNVLATVVAYQRGKIKRKEIDRLDLSPMQQRAALTLAALLRITAGLSDSGNHLTKIRQIDAGRDHVWVVIDGTKAASDAVVAQHKANLWAKIGYPEVKVLESAEAAGTVLPYPELADQIGLEPCESLAEAARKVMRFHFSRMLHYETDALSGNKSVPLHDMRVAIRRLRVAFEVFGNAFEPGVLKTYLKGLRLAGRSLGRVRDLDVLIEKAQTYLAELPKESPSDLEPLLGEWQSLRQHALSDMLEYMNSAQYHAFKREFNVFLNTPGAGARPIPQDQPEPFQTCELAPVLIYHRMAAVRAYDPHMKDASVELLHALRIDFKKLRYTVEYFSELLGETAGEVIKDLEKMQDYLGDLNDAHVATVLIKQFVKTHKKQHEDLLAEERQKLDGVAAYRQKCREDRKRLIEGFGESWTYINRPVFRSNLARAIEVL